MTPAFTFFVGLAMLVLFGWYDILLRALEIAAARTPGGQSQLSVWVVGLEQGEPKSGASMY